MRGCALQVPDPLLHPSLKSRLWARSAPRYLQSSGISLRQLHEPTLRDASTCQGLIVISCVLLTLANRPDGRCSPGTVTWIPNMIDFTQRGLLPHKDWLRVRSCDYSNVKLLARATAADGIQPITVPRQTSRSAAATCTLIGELAGMWLSGLHESQMPRQSPPVLGRFRSTLASELPANVPRP